MQVSGETVGEVKQVADMHERKAEMAKNSDAFIALPGNYIIFFELAIALIIHIYIQTLFFN